MDQPHNISRAVETAIEAEHIRITRLEPRLRRFQRVMTDLLAAVPSDWASLNDDATVDFSTLTGSQFDHLLCLLEDIAMNRPIRVIVLRGGPNLFDPGAPAGPTSTPIASTVHMSVPR